MTNPPMTSVDPEAATRRAFDEAAGWYDQLHESDAAWRASRARTHRIYLKYFNPGNRLLEINCGTGIDAVALACRGMSVHATDLSPVMIEAVAQKIRNHDLEKNLSAEVLAFNELNRLNGQIFDGIYSNFAGLNCTNDLATVADALSKLIRPGGYFIATIMTDFCLWETCAMLLRLRGADAFRRRSRGGVSANLGGERFPTYYFSPEKFLPPFRNSFAEQEIVGLNIFTPPLNHLRAYRMIRPLLPLLYATDDVLSALPLFRRIGDHAVIVLRRKGA